jgi:hypothetical protein
MTVPAHIMEARKLVAARVPFLHQGRTADGLDCAGAIDLVGARTGVQFDGISAYEAEPSNDQLRTILRKNLGEPRLDKRLMQIGDVAVIRWVREAHHVALIGDYVHGGFSLIHCYAGSPRAGSRGSGHVVEHRIDDKWLSRIMEVYPWPV